MGFSDGYDLRRTRAQLETAIAAIKADPVVVVHDHSPVVDVVHHGHVHIVYVAVIEEVAGVPIAALIADAHVAEAIIHASVEANVRTPVAMKEAVAAMGISPIAGGPERPLIGSLHPDTGNPVIACRSITPVARCPEIVIARCLGLLIFRQRRRWLRRVIVRRLAVVRVIGRPLSIALVVIGFVIGGRRRILRRWRSLRRRRTLRRWRTLRQRRTLLRTRSVAHRSQVGIGRVRRRIRGRALAGGSSGLIVVGVRFTTGSREQNRQGEQSKRRGTIDTYHRICLRYGWMPSQAPQSMPTTGKTVKYKAANYLPTKS